MPAWWLGVNYNGDIENNKVSAKKTLPNYLYFPSSLNPMSFKNYAFEQAKNIAATNPAAPKWLNNDMLKMAILDLGATGNFLIINAPVCKINPNVQPLQVTLLDGNNIEAMVQGENNWPHLPPQARKAYIIPKLTGHSLISMNQLTDAGCDVIFKHDYCVIIYQNHIVMHASLCPKTQLWLVPLNAEKYVTMNNEHTTN